MAKLILKSRHKVLCADCTVKENVDLVMGGEKADMVFTDAPYGIGKDIEGDEDIDVLIKSIGIMAGCVKPFSHIYFFCAPQYIKETINEFSRHFTFNNLLPIRNTHVQGMAFKGRYTYNYEACIFGDTGTKKLNKGIMPVSETTAADKRYDRSGFLSNYPALWDEIRVSEFNLKAVHPTQKNVSMSELYIKISSLKEDTVFDGFLGSGTTIIACHKTKRHGRGLEIDPHWCDVICQRFLDYSGIDPILESTGKKFSELKAMAEEMPGRCS